MVSVLIYQTKFKGRQRYIKLIIWVARKPKTVGLLVNVWTQLRFNSFWLYVWSSPKTNCHTVLLSEHNLPHNFFSNGSSCSLSPFSVAACALQNVSAWSIHAWVISRMNCRRKRKWAWMMDSSSRGGCCTKMSR